MFHVPEKFRLTHGPLASPPGANYGMFIFPVGNTSLRAMASDGSDWQQSGLSGIPWEHVSVSTAIRIPTWDEMCFIKRQFWDRDDVVIQFHPPESEYVNCHPFTLHLWRPVGIELPRPPRETVG